MNENLKKEIDERIEAFKKEIYAKIDGGGFPDKLPDGRHLFTIHLKSYTYDTVDRKTNIACAISELIDWQSQVGSGDWIVCTEWESDKLRAMAVTRVEMSKPLIGFSSKEAAQHILDRLSDNCKAYLRGGFSA
jgi:hypothetical protein